jgi:hypothetical protein
MPRISIIHPEGNFNNNPNLSGIVSILVEAGYTVTIYAQRREEIDQSPPAPHVHVELTSVPGAFPHDTPVVLPSIAIRDVHDSAKFMAAELQKPDIIIGIDRGIIEASALATAWNIPVGLLSYEIYFSAETSSEFKAPEIDACRSLAFAVCQDRARSTELRKENGIPLERIIDIPVAGRGYNPRVSTSLIQSLLGIDEKKKIALYMGELSGTWNGLDEILAWTHEWPEEWVLVLHHRYGNGAALDLVSKVLSSSRRNVFFSPFPTLPFDKLSDLLHSVDLGLAFYQSVPGHPSSGRNLGCLGMASGKISTYLQHGVPIVINEIGEMSDYVRKCNLGSVVQDGSKIGAVLNQFSSTPQSTWIDNSQRFFSTKLDLNITALPLLAKLQELLK